MSLFLFLDSLPLLSVDGIPAADEVVGAVGDRSDSSKSAAVDLVLRRPYGNQLFDEVIYGDESMIAQYQSDIEPLISEDLLPSETMNMALI